MFDDMKTKGAIEKIEAGGTAKLSRSQIVLSCVNLRPVFAPLKNESTLKAMPPEQKQKVMAIVDWYKDIRKDKAKEEYDQEKLDKVRKEILDELAELQGPDEEEVEKEAIKNDEDIKEAEDIDMDDFFGDK